MRVGDEVEGRRSWVDGEEDVDRFGDVGPSGNRGFGADSWQFMPWLVVRVTARLTTSLHPTTSIYEDIKSNSFHTARYPQDTMDRTLTTQLKQALTSASFPLPSPALLTSLLSTTPSPSLPRLTAQAKSQILTSPITAPSLLDTSVPVFPRNLLSPALREGRLQTDVPLQVVDVEDLSRSRWEQIEELERVERGEGRRGRAIVRVEDEEADDEAQRATQAPRMQPQPNLNGAGGWAGPGGPKAKGNTTHKLTLQDRAGTVIPALELVRNPRVGLGVTRIGEKIILKRGAAVARGTVLLEPSTCIFLGGYVEVDEGDWVRERLGRLRGAVGAAGPGVAGGQG